MSPEAIAGQFSFASDVYSLGMVICEIICDGEEPFHTIDTTEMSDDVLATKVPRWFQKTFTHTFPHMCR